MRRPPRSWPRSCRSTASPPRSNSYVTSACFLSLTLRASTAEAIQCRLAQCTCCGKAMTWCGVTCGWPHKVPSCTMPLCTSCSRGRKHAGSEATYRWDTARGSCCTRCSPCGQLAGHLMQTMSRTVTRLATPMRRAILRRRINLKKHKRLRATPRLGLKDKWSPPPIPM